jgi:hypothetical protein
VVDKCKSNIKADNISDISEDSTKYCSIAETMKLLPTPLMVIEES